MRIIGCDLHARQQTISMLDSETGEVTEKTPAHEGDGVREFYAALPQPVLVGLEATGSMFWFLRLLQELGIDYRVGHPAAIRQAETRKQKHDRRDAELIRRMLEQDRFPQIWLPSEDRPVETVLSSQVGAERSGQSSGGHSAKVGHSAVDHAARPDRLHRVLPSGRTAVPPCGNA